MEHDDYHGTIGAGCVCAEKMSGDYVGPRIRERILKKRASRKSRWLTRKWRESRNWNPFMNIKGKNIVVFKYSVGRKSGKWGYKVDGAFGNEVFDTEEAAKLGAFDGFWKASQDE